MSIVLVIIGLIVGGVLAGRELIATAHIRQIIAEYHQYSATFNSYQNRYGYLPGDHPDAWNYFANTNYRCTSANNCNGDGDGRICYSSGTVDCGTATTDIENYKAIAHIESSGLIPIDYALHPSTDANLGFARSFADKSSCWAPDRSGNFGHIRNIILFGSYSSSNYCQTPVFTNLEAYNIDKKIDDGHGAKGRILGHPGNGGSTCVPAGNFSLPTNATYSLNIDGKACILLFSLG